MAREKRAVLEPQLGGRNRTQAQICRQGRDRPLTGRGWKSREKGGAGNRRESGRAATRRPFLRCERMILRGPGWTCPVVTLSKSALPLKIPCPYPICIEVPRRRRIHESVFLRRHAGWATAGRIRCRVGTPLGGGRRATIAGRRRAPAGVGVRLPTTGLGMVPTECGMQPTFPLSQACPE